MAEELPFAVKVDVPGEIEGQYFVAHCVATIMPRAASPAHVNSPTWVNAPTWPELRKWVENFSSMTGFPGRIGQIDSVVFDSVRDQFAEAASQLGKRSGPLPKNYTIDWKNATFTWLDRNQEPFDTRRLDGEYVRQQLDKSLQHESSSKSVIDDVFRRYR